MTPSALCKRIQQTKTTDTRSGYEYPSGPVERIRCADGFELSVQAGKSLYCTPRRHEGPWTHVEVGFPSAFEETLMPWVDGDQSDLSEKNTLGNVYGYVPIEIVCAIIERHGGETKVIDVVEEAVQP